MDGNTIDGLNVRIAKLVGWQVEQRWFDDQNWYYVLLDPTGKIVEWEDYDGLRDIMGSEREAWQHAPDYEHDLNAVWRAVPHEEGWSLELWTILDGKPAAMLRRLQQVFYGRDAVNHEQAAALALEALLVAQQTQEAGGE